MQLFQSPLKKQCCAHKIAPTELWHLGKTAPKIFACVSNQCQQATLQSCSICVYTHTYSFLSPVKPILQQHFLYKAFSKSQMLIFHCLSNIFCTQNIFLKLWKQHILPSFQQHFLLSSLCCLFFSLTFDYAYYLKQSFFPSISPSSIFFSCRFHGPWESTLVQTLFSQTLPWVLLHWSWSYFSLSFGHPEQLCLSRIHRETHLQKYNESILNTNFIPTCIMKQLMFLYMAIFYLILLASFSRTSVKPLAQQVTLTHSPLQ